MNKMQGLLIALLSLPILEVYLLIKIGGVVGFLPTLLLLFGAAVLGTYLLQTQGWSAWQRFRENLAQGRLPERDLVDSLIILAGGALLLVPGFLSDVLGLLCLIPSTRKLIGEWWLRNRWGVPPAYGRAAPESETIEGEYRREE